MKEIYIVTQYDRPVIAMEGEKDAAALAEKLGGKVEPVQLVERRKATTCAKRHVADDCGAPSGAPSAAHGTPSDQLGELTEDDFAC